jgi:hypothetical protein
MCGNLPEPQAFSFMQYSSSDPVLIGHWTEFIASFMFLAACFKHASLRGYASSEAQHAAVPFLRGRFPVRTGRQRNAIHTNMSSEYTPSGSRRSSRRGGGRRQDRGNRTPRPAQQQEKPVKKEASLLSKIIGFFTGKQAEPERPARTERERRPRSSENGSNERSPRERSSRSERPTGMRSPEVVEVTSPRLYVGNLSFDAAESDLFELFNGVGSVQNVEIVVNRHTMRSKGFAFIQMQSIDEAKRAVSELHDKEFMGRKLVVSGAKAVEERRSERQQESAPAEPAAAAE